MQDMAPGTEPSAAEKLPGRGICFALIVIQLTLVAAVVHLYHIEAQRSFFPLLCGIIGGFVIHASLPAGLKLPFFSLLSVASVVFFLEWDAVGVLAAGAVLIGICQLPVRITVRVGLLLAAAVVLVVLRSRYTSPALMVLGSMFMFRLAVFVCETRHAARRATLAESTAYFFMLPNVCFPFFPVVDFQTFRESRKNHDERETWQSGVHWMLHGIVHLLLFRYLRSWVLPPDYEVEASLQGAALFMVTSYAMYLGVSGIFHLITGILHLFGFALPRTHDHYFLAASFSDIWRRINIYWKDFMTKLIFFPTFHALRHRGWSARKAIVGGVACVFLSTWLLHSWQWFWLLGRFPLKWHEAVLWTAAGACVAVNAVLDTRRRNRRSLPAVVRAVRQSTQIVCMFCLISLFWAWWWKADFMLILGRLLREDGAAAEVSRLLLWPACAIAVGTVIALLKEKLATPGVSTPERSWGDSAKLHLAALGVLAAVGLPQFAETFRNLNEDLVGKLVAFQTDRFEADEARGVEGYYEELSAAAVPAGGLLSAISPQVESRREQAAGFLKVSRRADIYQDVELRPGIRTELNGNSFSVNQFGMRDRESLTREKPAGVVRIACLGSSIVMGYGVADDAVFTRPLENDLNRSGPLRYQVLNFGVGKQWATHRLVRLQRQVFRFDPDVLFYFVHQDEFQVIARHIATLLAKGYRMPSETLNEMVRQSGVTDDMSDGMIQGTLARQEPALLEAVYRSIVDECRRRDVIPVWIYLPVPDPNSDAPGEAFEELAAKAGFITCNLADWAAGQNPGDLFPPGDTQHPNAAGHRLIAAALRAMVQQHPEVLPTDAD